MTATVQSASTGGASLARRIYGFGSIFGKTLRDSRRATLVVAGFMALILIGVSKAIVTEFDTPASRLEIANLVRSVPPIMQGLAGKPVNVETLGGYMQYKYGTFFPLVASLWSILALSGTLAAEARRGSLEFVAAAPVARRRIALEKLSGHLAVIGLTTIVVFLSASFAGSAFAVLPGDEVSPAAAGGYALWLGLVALASGAVAFAASQFVGRGAAVGIAGAVLFGGFILNGYQGAIPQLAPLANLTWFGWTTDHLPLAGQFDWGPLALVAFVAAALFVVGVEAFVRRDIGATSRVPWPSMPAGLLGLRGPTSRAVGEALPAALAWGLGIGLFGLMIAASGQSFVEQLNESPDLLALLQGVFPNVDIASAGGFLQLLFVEFGVILAGLAAATLVARWASDETSGRLEFLLATPLARVRWAVAGGLAVLVNVALIVVLTGAGILVGAAITGGDVVTPTVGTLVLGLYAIALAGVGIAIGGLFGSAFAGPAVAIITIAVWAADILGPALGLPDAIHDLALTAHYGQPMLGIWDGTGIVASLAIAALGVAIGAWGFARRDLRT